MQSAVVEMGGQFVLQHQPGLFQFFVGVAAADQSKTALEQLAGIENLKIDGFVGCCPGAAEQRLNAVSFGLEIQALDN
jgi:hypothetical protein